MNEVGSIDVYYVCNLGLFVSRRSWLDMVRFANDDERLVYVVEVTI